MKPKSEIEHKVPPFLIGNDKKTVILRAAHKLFLRDGYTKTSMDAVTKEAGVSKATVYAYFDTKEKLFETIVRAGSQSSLGLLANLEHQDGNDPRQELMNFFEPFLTILFKSGGYVWSRMVISEAINHPENARLFYSCTIERLTTILETYFASLQKKKLIPAQDISTLAFSFISIALLGPAHKAMLIGVESIDFRKSLNHAIELACRKV